MTSLMESKELLKDVVEKEYKKETGIKPADIAKLRQWLKSQPHLPADYLSDLDLILAYHCCNRSFTVSKEVLDLHYTLNTLFTGYFKNRKVDANVITSMNNILYGPLPMRTSEGYAILFFRIINTDPKVFNLETWIRTLFMVIDLWQNEEGTWPGLLIVLDYVGFSLSHLAKVDLQNLRQLLYYLQEAMLLKVKGLHFINAPSFIDKLLLMMRPFLKKEMMDMLHIHTPGSDTVKKFLPVEALPKESGGEYKTMEECKNDIIKKMQENAAFFENENKKLVNETLRPGKQKTISDIFGGVEGSFKNLDID